MMPPLRLLHITHNYPRFPADPAGGFVARLARAAAGQGAQVHVIAPHTPGAPPQEVEGGVQVTRFRYAPDALERIGFQGDVRRSALSPAALLAAPGYLWAFRRALRRALGAFRPEVIHAHWWLPAGWVATGQRRVPVVVTCHGSDVRLLAQHRALRPWARRVLGRAAAVSAVSRVMVNDLRQLLPGLATRVEVLPLPVELGRFAAAAGRPRPTPPRILFAGNLIAGKGVDLLVDAFADLVTRGVPCELKLLGEGAAEPQLRAQAARLGVTDRIAWSRFVPMDRMPEEYAAATVVALPSRGPRGEGLPLSLVEALMSGCAVVATPAGGVPEIVEDGVTGWLVPDGDAGSLARALREALTDATTRETRIAEGRRRVERRFAPEPAAAAFLELYRDVMTTGAPRVG